MGGILLPGETAQIANPDSAIGALLALAHSTRKEWTKDEIERGDIRWNGDACVVGLEDRGTIEPGR